MSPVIRPEATSDHAAIWEVNWLAFGRDDEARLVGGLRGGGYARVSLVAAEGGRVVGHILFGDLPIGATGRTVEALALAPLAVLRSHQRRGIESMRVREGLRACTEAAHRIVVALGHPDFYPRFGFSAELAGRLKSPFSGPAFMAVELVPGALEGVEGEVRYPPRSPGSGHPGRAPKWRPGARDMKPVAFLRGDGRHDARADRRASPRTGPVARVPELRRAAGR